MGVVTVGGADGPGPATPAPTPIAAASGPFDLERHLRIDPVAGDLPVLDLGLHFP